MTTDTAYVCWLLIASFYAQNQTFSLTLRNTKMAMEFIRNHLRTPRLIGLHLADNRRRDDAGLIIVDPDDHHVYAKKNFVDPDNHHVYAKKNSAHSSFFDV